MREGGNQMDQILTTYVSICTTGVTLFGLIKALCHLVLWVLCPRCFDLGLQLLHVWLEKVNLNFKLRFWLYSTKT